MRIDVRIKRACLACVLAAIILATPAWIKANEAIEETALCSGADLSGRDFSRKSQAPRGDVGLAQAADRQVLDNGMVVIVEQMWTAPVVALELLVKAGSATEGEYTGSGISHFVEHMLFKGTESRPVGEIERQIKSLGGQIGGFTSHDYTGYKVVVPAKHFREALEVLADCLVNSQFEQKEIEKEREVIHKEMKLVHDDPDRHLSKLIWSSLFTAHPYRHPVIGYQELFDGLTREDLLKYYKDKYVPNNMVLVVTGSIPPEDAVFQIKEAFQDFQRGRLSPVPSPEEPLQMGMKEIEENRAINLARLALCYHTVSVRDEDLFALDVLAMVLGQGQDSRLNKKVFKEEGLVYSIGAFNHTPKDPGFFGISCLLEEANVEKARSSILSQVQQVKKAFIRNEELKKAKRACLSSYIFGRESVEGQARDLGISEVVAGDFNFSKRYVEGINSVTLKEIRDVAKRFLRDENLTVVTLLPEAEVEKKKERGPTPSLEEIRIEKRDLKNKARILLRQVRSLPMVSINVCFKGGVRVEDEAHNGVSLLTSRLLSKGTKGRSSEDIARELESIGASLSTYSANNSFGISMKCLSQDLDRGLDILSDFLKNSIFPGEEFERERKNVLAEIRGQQEDIFAVGSKLLKKTMFQTHPYRFHPLGSRESLQNLKSKDCLDFYRRYCTADNMVLALFGDIDIDEAFEKVQARFEGIAPSQWPAPQVPQEPKLEAPREAVEHMPKQQALLMMGFHGVSLYHEDRFAFEVLGSILSGMSGRLFSQIRQKEGRAYTLGAYSMFGIDPGYFGIYVSTDVEYIEDVKQEAMNQVSLLATKPVGGEELGLAKKELVGLHQIGLQTNSALAFTSCLDELYGLGFENFRYYAEKIEAVTAEDVIRVARKYLDPAHSTSIVISNKGSGLEFPLFENGKPDVRQKWCAKGIPGMNLSNLGGNQ